MGGYAALLFGSLIKSRFIIAFGPQTNMERDCNSSLIFGLMKNVHPSVPYRSLYELDTSMVEEIFIVYGENDVYDRGHVETIKSLWTNVQYFPQPCCLHHESIKSMMNRGELTDLINSLLIK